MNNLSLRRYAPQGKPFPGEVRPPGRSDLIKGQALLIVLLVMAVGLTIGLSVISRSVTDIRISQQTEEAARAFSAAEAGIETALIGTGDNFGGQFPETGASYQAAKVPIGGGTAFAFTGQYDEDEPQVLWLADYEEWARTGNWTAVYQRDAIRILWGNPGTNPSGAPALEVIVYYKDGGNYKAGRFALDPDGSRSNSFCKPPACPADGVSNFNITDTENAGDKDFQFRATLDLSSFNNPQILLFARLRLIYSEAKHNLGTKIPDGAGGTGNFPSQGTKIDSTGAAGTATRKVQVVRFHPAPPAIFDAVLYSGGNLSK